MGLGYLAPKKDLRNKGASPTKTHCKKFVGVWGLGFGGFGCWVLGLGV